MYPQYKRPLPAHLAKTTNTDSSSRLKITECVYYFYSPLSQKFSMILRPPILSDRTINHSFQFRYGPLAAFVSENENFLLGFPRANGWGSCFAHQSSPFARVRNCDGKWSRRDQIPRLARTVMVSEWKCFLDGVHVHRVERRLHGEKVRGHRSLC